jgi:hypothetical protein
MTVEDTIMVYAEQGRIMDEFTCAHIATKRDDP